MTQQEPDGAFKSASWRAHAGDGEPMHDLGSKAEAVSDPTPGASTARLKGRGGSRVREKAARQAKRIAKVRLTPLSLHSTDCPSELTSI